MLRAEPSKFQWGYKSELRLNTFVDHRRKDGFTVGCKRHEVAIKEGVKMGDEHRKPL